MILTLILLQIQGIIFIMFILLHSFILGIVFHLIVFYFEMNFISFNDRTIPTPLVEGREIYNRAYGTLEMEKIWDTWLIY